MKQVFYNGKILTMSNIEEYYDYMVVEDHIITELGLGKPYLSQNAIDLEGKFVCPGFIDTHMHLLGYGASLNKCQLENCKSIKELQSTLLNYINENDSFWIEGRGWNHDLFEEKRLPTKEDLDAICNDQPIILTRACGHIALVNSFALNYCNITSDLQISGGAIDVLSGELTGILRENALNLVSKHIEPPTDVQILKYLKDAQDKLFEYGITTVHTDDLTTFSEIDPLHIVRLMQTRIEEPLRIYEQVQCLTPGLIEEFASLGLITGSGNPFFRIGPLKILADGSLGSRTARLSIPYKDDPGVQGILIHTESDLEQLVKHGIGHGFDLAIHAIGDYTNNLALDLIKKYDPESTHLNSIVHSQIMTLPLIKKMAALNVNALVQPVFLGYDMFILNNRVTEELAYNSYAYKTMKANGIKLGFGSDCPVESPNPFESIHYAVTRTHPNGQSLRPEEQLNRFEALAGFTRDAAFFSHESNIKGQLKKGYLADFVILDRDPFKGDLLDVVVEQTYIDGKCVYSKTY